MTGDFWTSLSSAIRETRGSAGTHSLLRRYDMVPDDRNEAIFFLKPEITSDARVDLDAICREIDFQLKRFDIEVCACAVFNGVYLENLEIMAAHYGTINKVSRLGIDALDAQARNSLNSQFDRELAGGALVLGGHQFLDHVRSFNEKSEAVLWDNSNSTSVKLGAGIYAICYQVFGEKIIVLNGFHPFQLSYYTNTSHCIAVMILRSTIKWTVLRNQFVGTTDPTKAAAGSIRANLLAEKERFGLTEVNKGLNGVHLSAGPIEGYFEIVRFFGPLGSVDDHANLPSLVRTSASGNLEKLAKAHDNPPIKVDSATKSIFDASEEIELNKAIEIIDLIPD